MIIDMSVDTKKTCQNISTEAASFVVENSLTVEWEISTGYWEHTTKSQPSHKQQLQSESRTLAEPYTFFAI
jgi:hypothetical protein